MFAAVRYHQSFVHISKEDYEGCPDFEEIYATAVTEQHKLGASMEGGRIEKRAPDESHGVPAKDKAQGESKGGHGRPNARSTLMGRASSESDRKRGTSRRVDGEEPHKDPSLPSARTEPRAIHLQRKPLEQAKGSKKSTVPQDRFFIEKDLLYYRDPKGHERLCVPDNKSRAEESTLRHRLVKEIHDNAMAVHLGAARTTAELEKRAYWPHMRRYVQRHIERCEVCQRNKGDHRRPMGKGLPLQTPMRPGTHYSKDTK